ncbi:MAG: SpoIIE family protein phosphatase [Bacteroidia bacterium]|nr:SpoIIE family protein phosphatase [Bacteroidia bacterium]MDW8088510.1 SpoIIE family protein phosphatase [Bacteroidia bacterium]
MARLAEMMLKLMGQAEMLGMAELPLPVELADMMAKFFPAPVFVLNRRNNTIEWASPGALLIGGFTARELRRLKPLELLEKYFDPAAPLVELYQTGQPEGHYTGQFRSPEGLRFISGLWIGLMQPSGTCCQYVFVFQDITEVELLRQELVQYSEELQQQMATITALSEEKERLNAQLKEQNQKLRLLSTATAYSNMMKFILDKDGYIVWVNRTFEKASGWSAAELEGKHVREIGGSFAHLLHGPQDKPSEDTLIVNHFIRAPFTEEIYAYDRRGHGYWMLLTLAPITDELGQATHYLGAMLNIDQRKKREEQLKLYQKEMGESLRYAARIQQRFFSSPDELKKYFSDAVVWYAPQSMVGGDFYRLEPLEGGVLIGLGDSTGHGVPAALLSIYGSQLLRSALDRHGSDLKGLYTFLREQVGEVFGGDNPLLEGFELALLWYLPEARKAFYLGARRPLWVLRGGEMYVWAGDKQDISVSALDSSMPSAEVPEPQELLLEPQDRLYLFSDGLVDQLNPEGKRFSTSRLRDFLRTNSYLSLSEQVSLLQQALRHWAGGQPQTDDILLLALAV